MNKEDSTKLKHLMIIKSTIRRLEGLDYSLSSYSGYRFFIKESIKYLKEAKKEMAKIQDLTQDLWEHIKEEAVAAAYSTPNEKSWEERIQEQQKMKTLGPSVAMTRKRLATPPTASPRRQDPRADGRFSVTGRSTNEVIALRRARLRARGGGGRRRTKRKKRRTKRKKRRTKRRKRRRRRRTRRRR